MTSLTPEQLQAYWQYVATLQLKPQRLYVQTEVTGRQRLDPAPVAESPEEAFDPFGDMDFDFDLRVRTVVAPQSEEETPPDQLSPQPKEAKETKETVEHYGVLEGVLKYAGEHDDGNHVLLVGKPGSGKTTALERLVAGQELIEGRLPVLIRLRDLQAGADPVLERVLWVLACGGLRSREQGVALLEQGRLLLLLDGVNELPTVGGTDLRRRVQDFRERFRQTPMIFTTRQLNVGVDLGIGKKLEMEPLSPPQMGEFARRHLGEDQGQALLKQLGSRLQELGETPLLLWMLCGLFRKAGAIPANLGLVFRSFVALYDTWFKGFDDGTRSWQSRFLQGLALRMMPQAGDPLGLRLGVSRREAEDLLAESLAIPVAEAVDRLNQLLNHHLLQLRGRDELEFKHQLFQEYFAAEGLLAQWPTLTDLEVQKHYLNLLDWSEALALVAGLLTEEAQALRLVRLGLAVDLVWGARLAGEVRREFQNPAVGLVLGCEVPEMLRVQLLDRTRSESAIPSLLNALDDKNRSVRQQAVGEIGNIGGDAALTALLKALDDEDSDVRQQAVWAIGNIGGDAALTALLKALDNKVSSVRQQAVWAIGNIGGDAALTALLKALDDEDWDVRIQAVGAIGEIGGDAALTALLNALEHKVSFVRQQAARAIVKIGGDAALTALLKALEHEDWCVREQAVGAIGKIGGEAALPALLKVLEDEDSVVRDRATLEAISQGCMVNFQTLFFLFGNNLNVRYRAVEAIGQIGGKAALPALLQALDDDNWSVGRQNIVEAIGNVVGDAALPALLQALEHEDQFVRQYAAEAIGQIGGDAALPALLQALEHEDQFVRQCAAEAIGQIGGEAALLALLKVLEDENSVVNSQTLSLRLLDNNLHVRKTVVKAICQIGGEAALPTLLQALEDEDFQVRQYAVGAIGKIGGEALPTLLQVLEHEDSSVLRQTVVMAIGQIGGKAALPTLLQALEDEDFHVRQYAAEVIGKIGGEAALPALLQTLKDEDWYMRKTVVKAIGNIGGEAALPALLQALEDKDKDVPRYYAVEAICKIGGEAALPTLLQVLEHEDSSVLRQTAVKAIGNIGGKAALMALLKALENKNSDVRKEAVEAIGKIGGDAALPALLKALEDECPSVRQQAVEAIGKIGGDAALTALLKALDDEYSDVRQGAVEAIGNIGGDAALTALLKALDDKDWHVRKKAVEAIDNIGEPRILKQLWQHQSQATNLDSLPAILAIQNTCKLYNYEISQTPLPFATPRKSTMTDQPKVSMTFTGTVYGVAGTVEGDQNIQVPSPHLDPAIAELQQLLQALQDQHPTPTTPADAEAIIEAEISQIQQHQPQRWATLKQNLFNRDRWLQGGKNAVVKLGEKFAADSYFGVAIVAIGEKLMDA